MKANRTTIAICALALGVCAAVLAPAVSQAHKKRYATTVTAAVQNKNMVDGQVLSVPRCIAGRIVLVYGPTGALEDTTASDATGKWHVNNKNLLTGTHTVVVKRKVLRKNRRHKHICRAGTTTFSIT